jgi:hypothetical protein
VAHECPGRQILPVKFDRSLEVDNRLVVISAKGVVVADNTTRFRPVLLVLVQSECEVRKLAIFLLNVQNIAI